MMKHREGKKWQQERGERHGNNRKMYADLKVKERRAKRAKDKQELNNIGDLD